MFMQRSLSPDYTTSNYTIYTDYQTGVKNEYKRIEKR